MPTMTRCALAPTLSQFIDEHPNVTITAASCPLHFPSEFVPRTRNVYCLASRFVYVASRRSV